MSDILLCRECKNRTGKYREKEKRILCDQCLEVLQVKDLRKILLATFFSWISVPLSEIQEKYANELLLSPYPVEYTAQTQESYQIACKLVHEFNEYMEEKDKCMMSV